MRNPAQNQDIDSSKKENLKKKEKKKTYWMFYFCEQKIPQCSLLITRIALKKISAERLFLGERGQVTRF